MEPEALVAAFFEAIGEGADSETLLGYFAPDAVYHNMPMEPAVGHEAIRGVLDIFLGMATHIRFEVVNQIAAGNLIMNERIDHMMVGDRQISLPVAGAFEIVDGKIVAWRDYFDMAAFMSG